MTLTRHPASCHLAYTKLLRLAQHRISKRQPMPVLCSYRRLLEKSVAMRVSAALGLAPNPTSSALASAE